MNDLSRPGPLDRPWLVRGLLFALVAIAFANAPFAALLLDGTRLLAEDPRLLGLDSARLFDVLFDDLGGEAQQSAGYRPLTTLSYALQYAGLGHGAEPGPYVVVNALLHWLDCCLLWAALRRTTLASFAAFAAAALWAVHPLATEAVTYVAGRADLIAATGVLTGLWLCLDGGREPFHKGRSIGLALATVLALGGKESGIVLLPLLWLVDLCTEGRANWRQRFHDVHAWTLSGFAMWFVLRTIAADAIPTPSAADDPLLLLSPLASACSAALLLLRYLSLVVWPASLSADWSYDALPVTESWFVGLGAGALAVQITLAAMALRHRTKPWAFFALAWFVLFAPVANVALRIGTVFGERLAYLPMVAPLALAAIGLARIRSPRIRVAVLTALLAAFAARTHVRNRDWQSPLALWQSAVATAEGSFKAHGSLAVALHEEAVRTNTLRERIGEIVQHAERARTIADRLPPRDRPADAWINLAAFYRVQAAFADGEAKTAWLQKARAEYEAAVAIEAAVLDETERKTKGSFRLWLAWGQFLQERGESRAAATALERAIALAPAPEALLAYATTALAEGKARDATLAAARAVLLDPRAMPAWQMLQQTFSTYRPGGVAVVQMPNGSPGFHKQQDGLRALLVDAAKAQAAAMVALGRQRDAARFTHHASTMLGVAIDAR